MEAWRTVLRVAFKRVSVPGLLALKKACLEDDSRLLQGATTTPPPLQAIRDWPCEGACLLGYAGWQGEGLETVEDVESSFAKLCFEIDNDLGEPAGCRWLLNWFDETPRAEVLRQLLPEIDLELSSREEAAVD